MFGTSTAVHTSVSAITRAEMVMWKVVLRFHALLEMEVAPGQAAMCGKCLTNRTSLCFRIRPCRTILHPHIQLPVCGKYFRLSWFSYYAAAMSTSTTPTPPPMDSSLKKRKYDQLEQPPPPLPPSGSVLYITLSALPPPKHRGGVLDYRWAFLLAPDDKPDTRGRQYLVRESSPNVDPRNGAAGSSKGLGILNLEQQRRPFDRLRATHPFGYKEDTQKPSAWEFEIQDICMQSSGQARVRIQLPRIQDVESFEARIKDAFCESDGTRGADWDPVVWMGDAWSALVGAGDVLGVGGLDSEPVGWKTVQKTAMEFFEVQASKGRFEERGLTLRVPTWRLLERRLIVS